MQHNTKDRLSSNNSFPSPRDLDVVLEEASLREGYSYLDCMLNNNQNYLQQQKPPTTASASYLVGNPEVGRPLLPIRRTRAGTMPSLAYMDQPMLIPSPQPPPHPQPLPPSTFLSTSNNNANRHRSGSLTLPVPIGHNMSNIFNNTSNWQPQPLQPQPLQSQQQQQPLEEEPVSPSTEQLLHDDFSIARTLRSIGLDDDKPTPRLSSRNRSYSVNNTVMYQQQQQQHQPFIHHNFSSTETLTPPPPQPPIVGNRRRSSSMGRMDYNRLTPPGLSSLWQMQLDTLHDEEYESQSNSSVQEPSLSLGDSELLANILHKEDTSDSNNLNNNIIETSNAKRSSFIPTLPNSVQQNVSRSLWIGNIDASITVDSLTRLFSNYGPIESVRLLLEKECAFINYYHLEDSIHAKEDVLGNLGGRIGSCIVRIGYGRADNTAVTTPIEIPVVSQPTRALWLGNMPPNTSQAALEKILSLFGPIESIRVLSHKNCAFINYDTIESASSARDALLQNDPQVQDLWGIRIGFAKAPVFSSKPKQSPSNEDMNGQANIELWSIMKQFGAPENAIESVRSLQSASYFESIPPVPEYGAHRRHDATKLREIRKKLDTITATSEADAIAMDCMDELAEICSDYIGNTVVQRFFEKCSEDMKTKMLKSVAPHLAAMGVHKNGTWAAQKIIDSLKLPNQIQIAFTHIQPFIPPLLLDQFGNYVVQCCLRLTGDHQFIMNAMVEKFVNIAQGRFGARAMRGILEGSLITQSQQMFIAAALLQNSVSLSTHANGALLVSWLIESSQLNNRYSLLATRLAPHLTQIATHKLGSQILLKLINQDVDEQARTILLNALENHDTMHDILSDQARGLGFAIKVISGDHLNMDEKTKLRELAHPILTQLQGTGFKKALLEFVPNGEVEEQVTTTAVVDDNL